MEVIADIGSHLKKIYRDYSAKLLKKLIEKGFTDLRPSFLEILIFMTENQGPTMKEIGLACNLKKQTMTSHMNELVKRGYLLKKRGVEDKREQLIYFTALGEKFRMNLVESINEVQSSYFEEFGEIELLKIQSTLNSFYSRSKKIL